jgi:hypothetical protein
MSTVIDTLVLELGLDGSKFKTGANSANKDLKNLKGNAEASAKSFKSAAAALAGFFGITLTVAGVERLIDNVTKLQTQLGYMSKNLGMSTQQLKEWQNVAELTGGSAEGITSTMQAFSKAQTEMSVTGQSGMLPYMRALGVSMFDANGKARPLNDMLLDLSDRFSTMDRVQANNFGQMMGIDQGTMNMLLQGRSAMQDMFETQKKLHRTTEAEAKASAELGKARTMLNQQLESLGVVLVNAVTPALTSIVKGVSAFVNWLSEHEGFATGFFVSIAGAIGVTLLPMLGAAVGAVGALISPFLAVAAVIAVVGTAISLVVDDFKVFQKGGKSALGGFFTFFKGGWRDAFGSYTKIIDDIKNYFNSLIDFYKAAWRFIVSIFTGSNAEIRKAGQDLAEAFVKPFINGMQTIKDTYEAAKNWVTGKNDKPAEAEAGVAPAQNGAIDYTKDPLPAKTVDQRAKDMVNNSGAGVALGNAGVSVANGVGKLKEFLGGNIKGFNSEETLAFANRVMSRENKSGKLDTVNKWGYTGRYQFGASALAETGFIDKKKLDAASKGVKNGADASAHRAFLADKSNWLKGDWETYKRSAQMQDESFRKLVEVNLRYGTKVHGGDKRKMAGFAMAAHLKGAGNAAKWYGSGVDSKDGNGTRTSDYANFGENTFKVNSQVQNAASWAGRAGSQVAMAQPSKNVEVNMGDIKVYTTANTLEGNLQAGLSGARNNVAQFGLGVV